MLKKIIIIIILILLILGIGYILIKAYPDFKSPILSNNQKPIEITLEFWGIWDNSDAWAGIIQEFEKKNREINGQKVKVFINYTKKDFSSYKNELSEAKEKNIEPNIFIIDRNWLGYYLEMLSPLESNKAYAKEYGLITFEEILNSFPTETVRNLIYSGQIYSLPTYSDSLALYYNKDLFEKAGIKNPPETWKEFKDAAKKLTIIKNGEIVQSGAAMGSGKNINRSPDIVSLLMMQGGAKIIDQNKNIDIDKKITVKTTDGIEERDPGIRAIIFYTEFSDPKKEVYAWNEKQEDSLKSFADQKVAMIFGYSYQIANLEGINSELNYGISKMPQLENSTPINFSTVFTPVVSKNSNCMITPEEMARTIDCDKLAWSFLSFAVQKDNSKSYLDLSGKVAARKDLIGEQVNLNDRKSIFASQAENAISFNNFDDNIYGILTGMIDSITLDRDNLENIVNGAAEKIEKLKAISNDAKF